MSSDLEKRVNQLEKRCKRLEDVFRNSDIQDKPLEIDLTLPEADIDGLHFNETKVHAVFEKQDDGNYYSREILFHSARDADERTGRDLLSEYLDSKAVREVFRRALGDEVRVFLPEENQGIKKYNGVSWWYWLRPNSSFSAAYFDVVHYAGSVSHYAASAVIGVSPAFCVA